MIFDTFDNNASTIHFNKGLVQSQIRKYNNFKHVPTLSNSQQRIQPYESRQLFKLDTPKYNNRSSTSSFQFNSTSKEMYLRKITLNRTPLI